jgi:geranylgeranyl diphosphate synthase type II
MSLYTPVLEQHLSYFEKQFPTVFTALLEDNNLIDAMRYACEGGGKRLRPVLLMECCCASGGDPKTAFPLAAALELIHSYSLVHDDMPCMDNSPLRRGKPSVHAAFGETLALLTGDALLNLAFETALSCQNFSADTSLLATRILADCAGVHGMIGGQLIDLESEEKRIDLPTVKRLQERKTAALLVAACKIGATLGGGSAEQIEKAGLFGYYIGLSFQIIDDILDVTATAEALGKPVGSDAQNEKNTYVSLLGIEKARELAEEYTKEAISALSVFGEKGDDLRHLAEALLNRTR